MTATTHSTMITVIAGIMAASWYERAAQAGHTGLGVLLEDSDPDQALRIQPELP